MNRAQATATLKASSLDPRERRILFCRWIAGDYSARVRVRTLAALQARLEIPTDADVESAWTSANSVQA